MSTLEQQLLAKIYSANFDVPRDPFDQHRRSEVPPSFRVVDGLYEEFDQKDNYHYQIREKVKEIESRQIDDSREVRLRLEVIQKDLARGTFIALWVGLVTIGFIIIGWII